ncbi:histidine phosphatase family protein [Psychrobacillus sp. OK032]|uniref:histidine phosphatase family protein n=1 Tax=Psychrobacillus sp. OK032 TaxID=1884358 RepID=UPI0008B2C6F2|nr:histidine phosphatase family protein [Psychrobacillus sp. OK032]SES02808.1 alpha-ribazole phosphatase [Psychrobacillus sp. OK032]
MADAFTITLIRHLPTQGNRERKYIGWTDEPIIGGINSKKFSSPINQVVGSDLVRCKQTAAKVFSGIPYTANANFRECSFGDWEQKTYNELKEDALYRKWLDNPRQNAPPKGESLDQMEKRVLQAFYEVVEEVEHPIIITHGGPIRYLLTKYANVEKSFWDWEVPHGCSYQLKWTDKRDVLEGKRCTSFSVEHLMENEHT